MDNKEIALHFSLRLRECIKKIGFISSRSEAGVPLACLAKASGCSVQMARKYLHGLAIPEAKVLIKIASWLQVSPGWLLFGDLVVPNKEYSDNQVILDKKLLEYVIKKCLTLKNFSDDEKELSSFITDVLMDVSKLNTSHETIIKMVDMSISSIMRFNGVGDVHSKVV